MASIGTLATFSFPVGIAFDPTNGNIVVEDYLNNRIAVIDPLTAKVTTVAGNGVETGSDGLGTYVQVTQPNQIASSSFCLTFCAVLCCCSFLSKNPIYFSSNFDCDCLFPSTD